ncbi:hypothetical protein B7463_g8968, partial [Scytalidium lignicola]
MRGQGSGPTEIPERRSPVVYLNTSFVSSRSHLNGFSVAAVLSPCREDKRNCRSQVLQLDIKSKIEGRVLWTRIMLETGSKEGPARTARRLRPSVRRITRRSVSGASDCISTVFIWQSHRLDVSLERQGEALLPVMRSSTYLMGHRRVQKLEERLEGLIKELGQLHNQGPPPPIQNSSSSSSTQATSPAKLPSSAPPRLATPPVSIPSVAPNAQPPCGSWSDAASTPSLLCNDATPDIISRGILTLDYARTLLDTFRYSYTTFFPFVILSANTTVESLRREQPFLFLCIMGATAFSNTSLQHFLGKEIQKQIATKLVLALTLVFELGLHHTPRPKKFVGPPEDFGKMGSAERISRMFRRQHLLCDPEFAAQCAQELVDANERKSDKWIQHYVRVTIFLRQVNDTFSYHNPKYSKIMGEGSVCAAVDSFKRELEHLKRAAQEDLADQEISLFLELQLLDIWIHEVAFHDVLWENPISGNTTAKNPFPVSRINMLWHCLAVSKAYLTEFLDMPRAQMFQMPCITFSNVCYIVIIFCKTVLFHLDKDSQLQEGVEDCAPFAFSGNRPYPEIQWDTALAARESEFYRISSELHDKFAVLATTTDIGNGNVEVNAMWHFAVFVKRMLTGYERYIRKSGVEKEPELSDPPSSGDNGSSAQDVPSITAQQNISSNMNADSYTTGKGQVNNSIVDPVSVPMPVHMDPNMPADWTQDVTWETILEDIMMMPVPPR